MARTIKQQTTVEVAHEPFTLELPERINVQPTWVIPLSKTREALIYTVSKTDDKGIDFTSYNIIVVNSKTKVAGQKDNYYRHNHEFRHLFDVKTLAY